MRGNSSHRHDHYMRRGDWAHQSRGVLQKGMGLIPRFKAHILCELISRMTTLGLCEMCRQLMVDRDDFIILILCLFLQTASITLTSIGEPARILAMLDLMGNFGPKKTSSRQSAWRANSFAMAMKSIITSPRSTLRLIKWSTSFWKPHYSRRHSNSEKR